LTTPSQVLTTGDPGHSVAEHNPVAGFAHDHRGGISNPILGMLLFICSEVMFFSGLFAAYFNVRATSPRWPPIVTGGTDDASKAAAAALTGRHQPLQAYFHGRPFVVEDAVHH